MPFSAVTGPIRNAIFLALLALPARAFAQDGSKAGERAAAQVLFDAGREAMLKGDYESACKKFLASQRADPAAGTLLNLGNCEEKLGRLASAWERYRGALGELKRGDPRYDFAKGKVSELKEQVPQLTIELADEAPPGTQVWRNDTPIGGSLGIPLPLNPGSYQIVVEAPGFQSSTVPVELASGDRKNITVRPGEALPEEAPAPSTPIQEVKVGATDGLDQTTLGYAIGGIGVVGLGTALGFGAAALLNKQEREDLNCAEPFVGQCADLNQQWDRLTTTADIAGVIGGVALGVGLYLVLTDDDAETEIQAGSFPGYNGVQVRGVF